MSVKCFCSTLQIIIKRLLFYVFGCWWEYKYKSKSLPLIAFHHARQEDKIDVQIM